MTLSRAVPISLRLEQARARLYNHTRSTVVATLAHCLLAFNYERLPCLGNRSPWPLVSHALGCFWHRTHAPSPISVRLAGRAVGFHLDGRVGFVRPAAVRAGIGRPALQRGHPWADRCRRSGGSRPIRALVAQGAAPRLATMASA